MNKYYIYIFSCKNAFNVGMSTDLFAEIKNNFNTTCEEEAKLVFYEIYSDKNEAEERLSEMKNWMKRKIDFIVNLFNPDLKDWKKDFYPEAFNKNFNFIL